MIFSNFLGNSVSLLGFGAMRLPVVGEDQAAIDQPALDAMVDGAIAGGVNYFDTAYPYHGGVSEIALGKSLARYSRDSYFLADKYPGHQIAESYDPATIFEEQLTKCGVDYFDYYLLHNVYENSIDVYTNEQWGIADYFVEQKRNGRVRHLGFSCHGRPGNLAAFLEYGARKYAELKQADPTTAALFAGENIFEFCQIQLNYLDWTLQRADEKCALLQEAGIPIVVMEPLRGGRLATLDEAQTAALATAAPERSAVEWSLRWLESVPGVKVVLSGMSNLQQVQDNCRIYNERQPLTDDESSLLLNVAETLKGGVPCTACRYCVDTCPKQIDIPLMLATYNDLQFASSFTVSMQMDAVEEGHRADDCIDCRRCSRLCPQGIDIPEALSELAGALEKMPKWADLCRQREEAARALRGEA